MKESRTHKDWVKWSAFGVGFLVAALGAAWMLNQRQDRDGVRRETEYGSLFITDRAIEQLARLAFRKWPDVRVTSASLRNAEGMSPILVLKVKGPSPNGPFAGQWAQTIQQEVKKHTGVSLDVEILSSGE